jgi:hypothetical protein
MKPATGGKTRNTIANATLRASMTDAALLSELQSRWETLGDNLGLNLRSELCTSMSDLGLTATWGISEVELF